MLSVQSFFSALDVEIIMFNESNETADHSKYFLTLKRFVYIAAILGNLSAFLKKCLTIFHNFAVYR